MDGPPFHGKTVLSGSPPAVSIGMPVRNGCPWLREALESLQGQTHGDFELIISDNASTDGTTDICRAFAEGDCRVRFFHNEANIGAVANFNRVLDQARGEFFMWAACDDLWHPRFVETLSGLLRASPGATLAFCAFDNIDAERRTIRAYSDLFDLPSDDRATRLSRFLAQPEHLGKANLTYGLTRRAALIAAGGITRWSDRDWGGDMLVVFRLLSMGGLVLTRELLFHKRLIAEGPQERVPGGLSSRLGLWREELRDRDAYFRGYERLIQMANDLSQEQRESLQAIVRTRRREVRRQAWGGLAAHGRRKVARSLRRLIFLKEA